MDMNIAYWIAIVIGVIFTVIWLLAMLSIIKISRSLEDMVASNPTVKEFRAKKYMAEVLKDGYIHDPQKTNEAANTLSAVKDDAETTELIHRLEDLKKQND